MAEAGTLIEAEDILYVLGEFENVKRFAGENRLSLLDTHKTEGSLHDTDEGFDFQEIGIAEILLLPTANLINKPVKASGFRENYSINILGIQRKRDYLLKNLKDEKMHSGDILLVQGSWANIARLGEDQSQWVVLGQPLAEAAKVTLNHKAPVAALIMLGMIVTMMFDFIPVAPVTAVIVAALLMVLTGCFRNVEEAYKTINWESIVLIENRSFGGGIAIVGEWTGGLWAFCFVGRYLLHNFADDNVYQQYGHCCAACSYRSSLGRTVGAEPLSVPVCRDSGGKYVFCFTFLHAA